MSITCIKIENLIFLEENFSSDNISALAESIKKNGLLHEIVVAESAEKDRYVVICGVKRVKACEILHISEIPCRVIKVEPGKELETRTRLNLSMQDELQWHKS